MNILKPSPYLYTDGLSKARKQHRCDHCSHLIKTNELYENHHSNGPRKRCLRCVTHGQMTRHRATAKDLLLWLEARAEERHDELKNT